MRKIGIILLILYLFVTPVSALEITAPEVPASGSDLMPKDTGSFSEGLREILTDAIARFRPDLAEAAKTCLSVAGAVLLVSVVQCFSDNMKNAADLTGTVAIAALLLQSTDSLIGLGANTITELSEYGKLLLPVMTSAMAAQGSVTTSTALYAATAAFNTVLTWLLSKLLIPMIYIFLALAAANSALGEDTMKKLRDFVKWLMTWCLKTLLSVFTAYIGITGVVSGSTDAAALKATKMTISGMVPVVGGILSDASEAVLVSAGVVKNAAGIYGIFAILAVFLGPFLRIGAHYLMLKVTGGICGIFGSKRTSELIGDFGTAMGMLLGMTGAVCLLLLISTVCFLREVS